MSSILSQYLPSITYSCNFIDSIPSSNSSIILPNWTCNDNANYTIFDFSRFTNIESIEIGNDSFYWVKTFRIDGLNKLNIEIGNDSFYWVKTFRIDGLNKLNKLKIGQNSFTQNKFGSRYVYNTILKSFHILNCERLISIEIGEYSFTEFAGEFELSNLPSLQSIIIGYSVYSDQSYLVFDNSFIIRGI